MHCYAEWKRARVAPDYHIEVADHYYSVPSKLIRETVEARITSATVEVFHKGLRVASHAFSAVRSRHTTITEHMPSAHRRFAECTPAKMMRDELVGRLPKFIVLEKPNARIAITASLVRNRSKAGRLRGTSYDRRKPTGRAFARGLVNYLFELRALHIPRATDKSTADCEQEPKDSACFVPRLICCRRKTAPMKERSSGGWRYQTARSWKEEIPIQGGPNGRMVRTGVFVLRAPISKLDARDRGSNRASDALQLGARLRIGGGSNLPNKEWVRSLGRTTMDDNRERLSRIETVFGSAVKQTRDSGVKIDQELTVDAHVDHVGILVGGHSKALFKINAEGSIRGPILGFHDPIGLARSMMMGSNLT